MNKSSLLYREYLNRVIGDINNFEIDILTSFEIEDLFNVSMDIEDLSFISEVFKKIDYNYDFIRGNNQISTKLEIKSKLSQEGIFEFFLPEELVEIEDKILDNIGDYDITDSVGLGNMSMGDLEEESGMNKINNYMEELGNLYKSVIIDNSASVRGFVEGIEKSTVETEGLNSQGISSEEVVYGSERTEEETEETEETEDSLDYFSSKSIEEIEEIESIRDEEENTLEFEDFEEFEGNISDDSADNADDLWGESSLTNFSFMGDTDTDADTEPVEVNTFEDNDKTDDSKKIGVSGKGVTVLGVRIEKGKKIVEDKNVTEIDDILAKAVLLTTGGIIKIPQKATDRLQNFDFRGLFNNFVVDEDDEVEEVEKVEEVLDDDK